MVKKQQWRSSHEVKKFDGTASISSARRVVFNICGNKYRLVVAVNYKHQCVYIRFVGTHKQYDKIDAAII
jgi:mRNA interferase HigB